MTKDSKRLEYAYMCSEPIVQLNGLEEMDYVNTFLESIGDEPQCWRTTHSSMYPLWSGSTEHTQPSSLTHYQWRELCAVWKLETPWLSWPKTSLCRRRGKPFTRLMDSLNFPKTLNGHSLHTVRMMCFCVRRYSSDWERVIPNPNCV